ncbi:MAG: hypothetical protein IKD61_04155 [Oscillospiraceae bacterium]|nr:hypothetical protein [Oscillospiraceae bacterium]
MDELLEIPRELQNAPQLFLATIGDVNSNGVTLSFNGSAATSTRYKRVVTGQTLTAGDFVLVAKISGSYIILGKIAY